MFGGKAINRNGCAVLAAKPQPMRKKLVPVVPTVQAVQIVDGRRFGIGELTAKAQGCEGH
jgi:hypothetical protein